MLQMPTMQNRETQLQSSYTPALTKTAILVIGGAEDKVHGREILHTFFNRSGGSEAVIGIIPSASREPTIIGDRYVQIFEEMGTKYTKVLDVRDRDQGNDSVYLDYVEECTGIFLTGGDQLRLCGLLAETPLMDRIITRAQNHEITVGGTSAGAAVMGYHMIAGGSSGESPNRSLVDMAMGLGIIPEILVDQHFHNRNRLARLLSAIASHSELLGIGIDEDTCAMFESDRTIQVLGKGTVTIIDARSMSYTNQSQVKGSEPLSIHNLKLHVLCHGERYDLNSHQALPLK
ncbi:cyanophycinase [Stanieria cyanosphaera PCC 7437]|uniref:Cyanophycinase n=2 Tax=Stanieria cyanosphaera TaxID=102116 RepID=K9XPF1_STAC7|nr:cyanophycinase [Stanieria cyanosphaera]AFZ33926.1 cyanophycinase [Stanieria cyanosphaera PCC 7437]